MGNLFYPQPVPLPPAPATIDFTDENCTHATWNNFVVSIWHGETTVTAIELGRRLYEAQSPLYPDGTYLLAIIEASAPMPGPVERRALTSVLNSLTATKMSAVIFEGDGFRAAAVRSVVTGLSVFSRPPFPHKVFATVGEASRWFSTGPIAVDASLLGIAIGELRRRTFVARNSGAT